MTFQNTTVLVILNYFCKENIFLATGKIFKSYFEPISNQFFKKIFKMSTLKT